MASTHSDSPWPLAHKATVGTHTHTMADMLSSILDGHIDSLGNDTLEDPPSPEGDTGGAPPPVGLCIECEDQPAEMYCEGCGEDYCSVCWRVLHRKGQRAKHPTKALVVVKERLPNGDIGSIERILGESAPMDTDGTTLVPLPDQPAATVGDYFLERAKWVPVRLTLKERKYLRLLEAALNVSEYTDKIDILSYTSKSKRIVQQIKELCSILSGLVLAADYKAGQELFQDKDFEANATFFQQIFELGRRHKIMNPEKMRSTYGKLVYMLQDSQIPEVKEMLQFSCVQDIKTVYRVLEAFNGLGVLSDPLIFTATQEIIADRAKSRAQIQAEIKRKEKAIEHLAQKYSHAKLSVDTVRQCIYSIGDNHSFLRVNRDPCDKMIAYLKEHFRSDQIEKGYSLAIQSGRGGARLSHDHEKQYHYVLQSLSLWREILHEMFMLWMLSEDDLLSQTTPYRLKDTGQGLNRVQTSPRISRAMHTILTRAQQKVGYWVGSSVIHLGDHNVPNALMFIDKYTQIYRILNPIVLCIEQIPVLAQDPGIAGYFKAKFGGPDVLTKMILTESLYKHDHDIVERVLLIV